MSIRGADNTRSTDWDMRAEGNQEDRTCSTFLSGQHTNRDADNRRQSVKHLRQGAAYGPAVRVIEASHQPDIWRRRS